MEYAYVDPEFHHFGPIFPDKIGHSAGGENRKGAKIVMQPCFITLYFIVGIKVALHIYFGQSSKEGPKYPMPGRVKPILHGVFDENRNHPEFKSGYLFKIVEI